MKIIVGLGNPGEKYEKTRHNAGFIAVDFLIKKQNLIWQKNKKFNVEMCKNNDTIFIKPQTFMNNSGQATRLILEYYKLLNKKFGILPIKNLDLSEILTVIHDDIDIEFGKIKIATNSGSAGHRGVQSIIDYIKTKNFKRIRVGIRRSPLQRDCNEVEKNFKIPTEKFVLQNFKDDEIEKIENLIKNT